MTVSFVMLKTLTHYLVDAVTDGELEVLAQSLTIHGPIHSFLNTDELYYPISMMFSAPMFYSGYCEQLGIHLWLHLTI